MKLSSSIRLKPDLLYVAPLLNLVLLLLIFFLLNSTLIVKSGISVTLPESSSAIRTLPELDPDVITMTVGPEPAIYFNRDLVNWETLPEKIRSSTAKSRHVIINADPMIAYGQVMKAQNLVLESGRQLSLGTRLPE